MLNSAFYEEATREFAIWTAIVNSGDPVHEPWKTDFRAFLRDVGRCSLFGYTLVRLDPSQAFEPQNVRWVQGEAGYTPNPGSVGKRKKRALVGDIPLEVLRAAAREAKNKSQLELKIYGAQKSDRADKLEARCRSEGLDLDHWTGRHVKKPWISAVKVTDYQGIAPQSLRRRVVREKLISYQCAKCRLLPVWQGEELTLHLDHADGNRLNSDISNLRFLCPNCHQQTKTWGNKRARTLPPDSELLELAKSKTRTELAAMYQVHPSSISHVLRKYY